jgi:hypothetical protein
MSENLPEETAAPSTTMRMTVATPVVPAAVAPVTLSTATPTMVSLEIENANEMAASVGLITRF